MSAEPTWTDADVEQLRALWHEGRSAKIIGEMMARTKNAVVGKVHRLRLPPRAPRPQPKPEAAETAPEAPAPAPEPQPAPPPLPRVRRGSCQWPIGEPREPGFRFCGDALSPDTRLPYCAAHTARATSPRKEPAA
jgi:GcrA cell cycle regulator